MDAVEVLETALRKAKKQLDNMSRRWPYGKGSLGSEMWGTMALAVALDRCGWSPYPEVRYRPRQEGGKASGAGRIDLLAICRSEETRVIAVETKSFGEREASANPMRLEGDAKRLRAYRGGTFENGEGKQTKFRVEAKVLLVVNWNRRACELWATAPKPPRGFRALAPIRVYEQENEHLSLLVAVG